MNACILVLVEELTRTESTFAKDVSPEVSSVRLVGKPRRQAPGNALAVKVRRVFILGLFDRIVKKLAVKKPCPQCKNKDPDKKTCKVCRGTGFVWQ
jgi:hypothetical protein